MPRGSMGGSIDSTEEFWLNLAHVLGITVESETEKSKTVSSDTSAKLDACVVGGDIGKGVEYASTFTSSHVKAISIAVKDFLERNPQCIVIDDFHFIEKTIQKKIVRELKPMVFGEQRVVVASITHRWNDVTEAVRDMGARIVLIEIPKWTIHELENIAQSGLVFLNIDFGNPGSINRLAQMSYGSPHIMQHLCRRFVRGVNDVRVSQNSYRVLRDPDDWDGFFSQSTIDDSEIWFDKLLSGPKVKGTPRKIRKLAGGVDTDIYGLVLRAISETGPKLQMNIPEIMEKIKLVGSPDKKGHHCQPLKR
ncbi:hypothetical protein [Corynebacterium sp.]|uniref:hypothetical protein n=1 Tax=Corynebacterium sp. TaxID=1720 RepID=UPI0028B0318F|nr:hypothetical protein [Corynebacterium sp.]